MTHHRLLAAEAGFAAARALRTIPRSRLSPRANKLAHYKLVARANGARHLVTVRAVHIPAVSAAVFALALGEVSEEAAHQRRYRRVLLRCHNASAAKISHCPVIL